MHQAKTIVPVALLAVLSTLTACDEPQGRPLGLSLQASPQDGALVVADRAFLVEAQPGEALDVEPDELVFHGMTVREDDDWQPGDLLVNADGTGFLRRVVDVEPMDGGTVVMTEEAELHELIAQGNLHGELRPFSEGLRLADDVDIGDFVAEVSARGQLPTVDQLTARANAQAGGFDVQGGHIELQPTTLVSAGGLSLDLTGGHFSFDPSLDMDVDFGWWSIERFEVMAKGTLDAEIGLRLGSDGEYEILDRSMKLWESPRYAWYGFVGPVPVVVVTSMELGATVSVATHGPSSVTMGAGAGSWVEVGAIYEDAGWSRVGDYGFDFRYSGPEFVLETELNARVALDGKLKVELYGTVGPQLTLSPWAQLDADVTGRWSADIGVTGRIGGAISLPWHDDIGVSGQLFDWSQRLAEGQL